jgi:uncharacterized membrane protein YbhN (UPF0104 family)
VVVYRIYQLWIPVIVGALLAPRVRRSSRGLTSAEGLPAVRAPVI